MYQQFGHEGTLCGPTSDPQEILDWAQHHDAVPAEIRPYVVISTAKLRPSVLHFLFGSAKPGTLELWPISSDSFFDRLRSQGLAMVYDHRPSFTILQMWSLRQQPPWAGRIIIMDPRRCNPTSLRERIKVMKERAAAHDVLSPEETLLRFADLYEELLAIIDELDHRHPEPDEDSRTLSRKVGGENPPPKLHSMYKP